MNNATEIVTMDIETLIPYWRNPRNNEEAIEKVKESIKAYGYQALIIVDREKTIIVGHTRYRALKDLGYKEIPVIVSSMSQKQAKEYRIIDNKTSEYATWTSDLSIELREFSSPEFRNLFFPEIMNNFDIEGLLGGVTPESALEASEKVLNQYDNSLKDGDSALNLSFSCPNCSETVTISKSDLMKNQNWE